MDCSYVYEYIYMHTHIYIYTYETNHEEFSLTYQGVNLHLT